MRAARRRLVAAGIGAVLLLAACGSDTDTGSDAAVAVVDDGAAASADDGNDATAVEGDSDQSTPDTDEFAADAEGEQAADVDDVAALAWTATDLGGNDVAGSDYAGGDVLLWMWAPWCAICNREAPEVAGLLPEYEGEVDIIGVAGRDDVDEHQMFVDRHGLGAMPTVVDVDGSLWASYGISYQPAWVFINQDGAAQVVPGALGEEKLRELLDALTEA